MDQAKTSRTNLSAARMKEVVIFSYQMSLTLHVIQDWPEIDEREPLPYTAYRVKERIKGKADASAGLSDERTRFIYSPRSPQLAFPLETLDTRLRLAKGQPFSATFMSCS